jgi:phenylalanyl-tRNA synthetase alpha chain
MENKSINDLCEQLRKSHPANNITETIISKVGRNLHLLPQHPINIVKQRIETFIQDYAKHTYGVDTSFALHDNIYPLVNKKSCFDDLLIVKDHPSRLPTDTYYLDDDRLLRTHTSAHQTHFLSSGEDMFLCTGDVYRRDEIDSSHYPVFHQMEGVKLFDTDTTEDEIVNDLKELLTGLAKHLFGDVEMRWNTDYFPFTTTSFELEVYFNDSWLEVLGCGVVHKDVLQNANRVGKCGWAFGLGLERLAMVLFQIPDIRLFWTEDKRFTNQFKNVDALNTSELVTFKSYSKFPVCWKAVSFWLPTNNKFHSNDVYDIVRNVAGELVEQVILFDEYTCKKTGRMSHAYRINYRHMNRNLTNNEVDTIQLLIREQLHSMLGVELK